MLDGLTWTKHEQLLLLSEVVSSSYDPEKVRFFLLQNNLIFQSWDLFKLISCQFQLWSNFIRLSVSILKSGDGNINSAHTGNPFWMCRFVTRFSRHTRHHTKTEIRKSKIMKGWWICSYIGWKRWPLRKYYNPSKSFGWKNSGGHFVDVVSKDFPKFVFFNKKMFDRVSHRGGRWGLNTVTLHIC